LTDIRIQINLKIRLRITFVSNFGVGGGLHSVIDKTSLISKGYTSVLSNMVSVIFAVLEVSF